MRFTRNTFKWSSLAKSGKTNYSVEYILLKKKENFYFYLGRFATLDFIISDVL